MPIKIKGTQENNENQEILDDLTSSIDPSKGSEKPNIVNNSQESFVKEVPVEQKRKLFANKKANIAIIVTSVIMLVTFLALKYYFLA